MNEEEIIAKLENHEKRLKDLEEKILESNQVTIQSATPGVNKLAEKIGVDVEAIRNIFDIENEKITVINILGNNEEEKTKNISLIVLYGYKYIFGNERVLSKEIRRNIAESRVHINNFSTYLNEMIPSLIRRMGKLKSPSTIYKLTPLGESEAKQKIKELCNG